MNKTLPIHCIETNGKHGNPLTLARVDREALFLWCKLCRKEHRFSRAALNQIWDELDKQQSLPNKEYIELA